MRRKIKRNNPQSWYTVCRERGCLSLILGGRRGRTLYMPVYALLSSCSLVAAHSMSVPDTARRECEETHSQLIGHSQPIASKPQYGMTVPAIVEADTARVSTDWALHTASLHRTSHRTIQHAVVPIGLSLGSFERRTC